MVVYARPYSSRYQMRYFALLCIVLSVPVTTAATGAAKPVMSGTGTVSVLQGQMILNTVACCVAVLGCPWALLVSTAIQQCKRCLWVCSWWVLMILDQQCTLPYDCLAFCLDACQPYLPEPIMVALFYSIAATGPAVSWALQYEWIWRIWNFWARCCAQVRLAEPKDFPWTAPVSTALASIKSQPGGMDQTCTTPQPATPVLGQSCAPASGSTSRCSEGPDTPPRTSEADPGLASPVASSRTSLSTDDVSTAAAAASISDADTVHQVAALEEQENSLASATAPQQQQQQQSSSAEPFWSNSSWSFGSHSNQNKRAHMEDRIFCHDLTSHPAFQGCKRAGLFGVLDGHGGHQAAEYLADNLLSYVLSAGADQLRADPLLALASAVEQAEQDILTKFLAAGCNAGSTLLMLMLVDDKTYIANVGDSRAVLCRSSAAQQLTRDHKPSCSVERQRIQAADPAAEFSCDGYLYGELAVARGIGSAHIKRDPSKCALIATPDLISVQLQADDDFIVLATDGLWDTVSNTEVVTGARRSLASSSNCDDAAAAGIETSSRAAVASGALADRAIRCCSQDNIGVITVLLHGRTITLPKRNSMLFRRGAAPST